MVILATVMESAAIKCYQCQAGDPNCIDPVGHNDLISATEYTNCYKADIKVGNQEYVARGGDTTDAAAACNTINLARMKELITSAVGQQIYAMIMIYHNLPLLDFGRQYLLLVLEL